MMTNSDPEEWNFLSHPHMNNVFFFLLTILDTTFYVEKMPPEVPEYAKMRHAMMMSL